MRTFRKDALLGLGTALLFGIVLLFVLPRAVVVPPGITLASTRPDFWPSILCIALIALSLTHAVVSFLSPQPEAEAQKTASSGRPASPLAIIALLIAYYYAIVPLGITVSSMLAFAALAFLYGEKKLKIVLATACILPIALYFFFSELMSIPLPMGALFY